MEVIDFAFTGLLFVLLARETASFPRNFVFQG
jgi:hypothetical protein